MIGADAVTAWLLGFGCHLARRSTSGVDIGLPTLDGYELGKRIRERHPDCRIVALTGYGQAKDHARSAGAGFFAHLVKPVRIDVFLEILG